MSESEQIKQDIDRICQKFHYDSQLTTFLHTSIPSLIAYYGIENKERIIETFENCEIHIQKENEDPSIFIGEYFDETIEEDLKEHMNGFFVRAFHLDGPKYVNGNVTLQQIIYIKKDKNNKFDWSDEQSQSNIVHEMCHAIKTNGHVKVEGDNIITYSGLIKSIYRYNPETGKIDFVSGYSSDLEEALNTLDELAVMSIMKNRVFTTENGYEAMLQMARRMMSFDDIARVVRKSQLSGSDEWIDYLGQENCALIIENFSLLGVRVGRKNGKTMRQQIREGLVAREILNEFFDNYKPKEIDFTDWSLEDIERYRQTGELPENQNLEEEHSRSL